MEWDSIFDRTDPHRIRLCRCGGLCPGGGHRGFDFVDPRSAEPRVPRSPKAKQSNGQAIACKANDSSSILLFAFALCAKYCSLYRLCRRAGVWVMVKRFSQRLNPFGLRGTRGSADRGFDFVDPVRRASDRQSQMLLHLRLAKPVQSDSVFGEPERSPHRQSRMHSDRLCRIPGPQSGDKVESPMPKVLPSPAPTESDSDCSADAEVDCNLFINDLVLVYYDQSNCSALVASSSISNTSRT